MLRVHPNKRIFPIRPRVLAPCASAPEDRATESRLITTKRSQEGPPRAGALGPTGFTHGPAVAASLGAKTCLDLPPGLTRRTRTPREMVRVAKDMTGQPHTLDALSQGGMPTSRCGDNPGGVASSAPGSETRHLEPQGVPSPGAVSQQVTQPLVGCQRGWVRA